MAADDEEGSRMGNRYLRRVQEELKRRLSEIIEFEARDPRLELVTVMDVEVSKDLRHAKVFVTASASDADDEAVLELLQREAGFFRSALASAVRMKHTPELHFKLDPVEDRARRIDELLDETGGPSEGRLS